MRLVLLITVGIFYYSKLRFYDRFVKARILMQFKKSFKKIVTSYWGTSGDAVLIRWVNGRFFRPMVVHTLPVKKNCKRNTSFSHLQFGRGNRTGETRKSRETRRTYVKHRKLDTTSSLGLNSQFFPRRRYFTLLSYFLAEIWELEVFLC